MSFGGEKVGKWHLDLEAPASFILLMQVKISTIVSHVNFEIFKCSKFQFKNIRLTEASEARAQGDSQEVEASAGVALLH